MGARRRSSNQGGAGQRGIARTSLIGLGAGAFLVINVAFGMTYSVIDLHKEASEAREAQELLLSLRAFTYSEATEMTLGIIGGQPDSVEDRFEQRVGSTLAQLPALENGAERKRDVRQAVLAYFDAVEREARAIASSGGDAGEAGGRISAEFQRVRSVLDEAAGDYREHADELARIANIELLLLAGFAVVIVGLLMRRSQRIKRLADIKALEQRQQAEARFSSLVQNSSDAILILEPDTTVRYASPSSDRVLGIGSDRLEGATLTDFVHPDDRTAVVAFCSIPESQEQGGGVEEFRLEAGPGSWISVEATRSDLREDPSVLGTVLNLRNITEQKQLEAQIRQSQKMEAIGQLAGGIAHDFNNLLTVILGNVEFLERGTPSTDPKSEDIAAVRTAAERAQELTRQLLVYSRKEIIRLEVVDPNQVLRDVERILRRTIPASIELTIKMADDLRSIRVDSGQLQQVLMNLVVNARDAMPKGGLLVIETENVTVDDDYAELHPGLAEGTYACIIVSDTGEGMTKEVATRVFEPFFTTKPRGAGTGLGLATVYGIVKRFDGYVSVYSEPGHGASFRVYLPVSDETATEREEPLPREWTGGGETILLVEDEDELRSMASRILEEAGYRVVTAGSGDEAVALSPSDVRDLDLVLTDVVMPGMNTRDMLAVLAERHPDLNVLYMSGYTDEIITRQGILEPGVRFVQKPFSAQILLSNVRESLDLPLEKRA